MSSHHVIYATASTVGTCPEGLVRHNRDCMTKSCFDWCPLGQGRLLDFEPSGLVKP